MANVEVEEVAVTVVARMADEDCFFICQIILDFRNLFIETTTKDILLKVIIYFSVSNI